MQSFVGSLIEMIAALEVQVPRREILRRAARAASLAGIEEPGLELSHDRAGDRLLRREGVLGLRVDGFRPEVRRRGVVDEMDGDAKPVRTRADTASQQNRGVSRRVVGVGVCVRHTGLPGHHPQAVELCETVNGLLVQAAAEVSEVMCGAVIREWKDRDGISPRQRGADRASTGRYRLTRLEDRRVTAFWQLDDDSVGPALFAVVPHQSGAQPPRLHTHDRVRARIERRVLVEDLNADDVFLELIATADERFEHDEAQKSLETTHLAECGARQDAVQLLAFAFVSGLVW